MALGKRIRNFVPLRAVNNRVIQAEFFRNAHGGTNIVRAVRVNMNGKPLCKQRFQRFELGVEFAQLPFLLRTLLFSIYSRVLASCSRISAAVAMRVVGVSFFS